MVNLDPSLAFTAVLEMRPGLNDPEACRLLAEAMTAANPPDRWAFARGWLDEHRPVPAVQGCDLDGYPGRTGDDPEPMGKWGPR